MRTLSRYWPELAVVVLGLAALLIVCGKSSAQCSGPNCPASGPGIFNGSGPVRNLAHAVVDGVGHGPIGEAMHQRPHVIMHLIQSRPHLFGHRRRGCG